MTVDEPVENERYKYRLNKEEDRANIIVFDTVTGQVHNADDKNKNFGEIIRRAEAGDFGDRFHTLFSMEEQLKDVFNKVSERVSIAYGQVYFDNEAIDNVLSKHILRSMNEGTADHRHLIAFWENIAANPSQESRDNLMTWLEAANFTITVDGLIVGYKGLRKDFTSIFQGPAIVDGVEVDGHVPNSVGSVVEMDRSKVDADRRRECSYGLHVGTWKYASEFARGAVAAVHVNPRDVVAVPKDCNGQKMRVARYTVVRQATSEYGKSVLVDNDWD